MKLTKVEKQKYDEYVKAMMGTKITPRSPENWVEYYRARRSQTQTQGCPMSVAP